MEESLAGWRRTIDLVQHHENHRFEDPYRIFDEGGRESRIGRGAPAGKISYIGFTGHKDPQMHMRMLDMAVESGVRFDAVQMPLNVWMHTIEASRNRVAGARQAADRPLAMKTLANGTS